MSFIEHHQETEPLGLSPLEHVAIHRDACLMEGESEDDQAAHLLAGLSTQRGKAIS